MLSNTEYKYPLPGNRFALGKLPPIRRKNMDRHICVGRVWIFLILGVLLIVFGLVSVGVYFNMDTITSSKEYVEVVPPLLNIVTILFSGFCVCLLFWKRLKALVIVAVVVCIASGLLCGISGVLNITHVAQPIRSFSSCRYYLSQKLCQCFSPYKRDMLSLEYSELDLTKYDFQDTGSCSSIQDFLPQLLYTLIAVYAVVLLLSFGSAIVALLVLRIETHKRNCFQDENYEEVYTVSGSSSQDHSDSEAEVVISTNQAQGQGSHGSTGNPQVKGESNSDTFDSNRNGIPSINGNLTGNHCETIAQSATPSLNSLQQLSSTTATVGQRSKVPALNDLGRESLANRYKINKTPDREIPYRHRISKTPDRELGSRRRNSVNLSKRLSKSCDSLESSGRESPGKQESGDCDNSKGNGKGKLKDHRRKGKRAATVHTLDRDQLLLILSLQMRYLQETKEQESQRYTQGRSNSRRAITPQPQSQKPVIPQKIRSHTPQPSRANRREKDPKEKEFYDQIETLLFRSKQKEQQRLAQQQETGWGNRTRNLSENSNLNVKFAGGNLTREYTNPTSINSSNVIDKQVRGQIGTESYLTCQQIYSATPPTHRSHTPYSGPSYNSTDSVHYITYSDNMLGKNSRKPKSRPSVQNCTLPPEPLHRGTRRQLPPQPISRQNVKNQPLPPQPIQRGQSAFQIVDRSSKSRSPSIGSERSDFIPSARKHLQSDHADVAIRENFQMNPSPFMFQYSQNDGVASRNTVGSDRRNVPVTDWQDKNPPTEILPPYSGPPSYHEYVSSCEHSVTSSLSSNPDDIYSMPKRRVRQEEDPTNHNQNDRPKTNQNGPLALNERTSRNGIEHIYGNAETYQQIQSHYGNKIQGQRSTNSKERYYGSPSQSHVKQFIVPEDYYTPVHKIAKQKDNHSHQIKQGNIKARDESQAFVPDIGQASKMNGRFIGIFNVSNDNQIAPDAKYHEYEDVYETFSPTNYGGQNGSQNIVRSNTKSQRNDFVETQPHSLLTHGFDTPNSRRKPKKKSKDKGPSKSKPYYPVSNVNARVLDFTEQGQGCLNDQVTSVKNVHAENLNKIPKIKLDHVESDDDDVFAESDEDTNIFQPLKVQNGYHGNLQNDQLILKSQNNVGNNSGCHSNIQIDSITSAPQVDKRTNENTDQGDFTSYVTDSGYMKMTLPVNSTTDDTDLTNGNSTNSNFTDSLNDTASHVTETDQSESEKVEHGVRELPDGDEADSDNKSESDCEETGV